jgi:hypothetical protein
MTKRPLSGVAPSVNPGTRTLPEVDLAAQVLEESFGGEALLGREDPCAGDLAGKQLQACDQ